MLGMLTVYGQVAFIRSLRLFYGILIRAAMKCWDDERRKKRNTERLIA